jgi:glucokinase
MKPMEKRYAIGVDVGASFTKVGLVEPGGRLMAQRVLPTEKEKGFQHFIRLLEDVVEQLLHEARLSEQQIKGLGIGLPAFLDREKGWIHQAINLGWQNIAVKEDLERRFPWPVRADNDANLAALAESWSGRGRGKSPLLCLTIGTGVGGGVVIDGRLFHGFSNMAGEIGHLPVSQRMWRCHCGKEGCLETVSSATGMLRLARAGLQAGFFSSLREERLTIQEIFRAAAQGDPLARSVLEEAGEALAEALAIVSLILNPERILLGGGVSQLAGDWHLRIHQVFQAKGLPRAVAGVEVLPAFWGNDAGMIGAAALFLNEEETAG